MKFGLRNGPWKTVFGGDFQGHDIEILINPDQTMLVAIYEKAGEEIQGIVLQAFALFSAVGEAETFVETLQKEAIILSRHDGKRTVQFLALASKPAYAKGKEEDVAKTVDSLLEETKPSKSKIEDVAKSFDLQLTPLSKCSGAVKQSFFSQPMLIPMLVKEKQTIEMEKEEADVETGAEGLAVMLGMTRDGKQVKEPLQMFQRMFVTDGPRQQRMQMIQIIIESHLLANIPVIIFDDGNRFSGLAHPTTNISELQSHGLQIEPIGFPTKEFTPGTNIKINLNAVNGTGLLELFGNKEEEMQKILETALKKGSVNGPWQLIDNIDSLGSDEADNAYLKVRLERVIKLIDTLYPEMFSGPNNIKDIVKSWFRKMGRANIVHTDKADPRIFAFLLDSISNELIKWFSQQGETGKPQLLVAIPEINKAFAIKENLVMKDFEKMLKEMKRYGISFVIGAEKITDLSQELLQIAETKAGVIKENDVAIDLPNAKNYRLMVRPTLSKSEK